YAVELDAPFSASMVVVGGAGSGVQTLTVAGSLTVDKELDVKAGGVLSILAIGPTQSLVGVAVGFTNDGTIDLSSRGGTAAASLFVGGTLLNSATGVISASPGTGGSRGIAGQLDNRGRIDILAPLTLSLGGLPNA